jgi:DNA mismatch endonuclease (patch repair protein)
VFVDGCFWHSCPKHGTLPRANRAFWEAKLADNRRRDAETDSLLRQAGWEVIRVWEHEDPAIAAARVSGLLRARRLEA